MPRRTVVTDDQLKQSQQEIKLFQEGIEFEKKKTLAQKGQLEKIKGKAGRPGLEEQKIILEKIGQEAEKRYQYNLQQTGYQGEWFKHAFKWESDAETMTNYYYLDTGNQKLNQILQYLEYGTGLYGSLKAKWIESTRISPRTGKRLLLKFQYEGNFIYKRKVKGIKPGFMFTKAVASIQDDTDRLIRYHRAKLRTE